MVVAVLVVMNMFMFYRVQLQAQEEPVLLVRVPTDFRSVQEAINNVSDGGRVEVENGTYYEYIRIVKPLTLVCTGEMVIDGGYRNYYGGPYQIYVNASDVTISGLTFQTSYVSPLAVGIYAENCQNLEITNNTFTDSTSVGIKLLNVQNARVFNNTIDVYYMPIMMHYSKNISFTYNVIRDASQQFGLYHSRNIVFHHNNVFNDEWSSHPTNDYPRVSNTTCTWDDGNYGNYWSDYTVRYPNATEIGSSGVWDTPYQIDPDDVDGREHYDYYPLTKDPQLPSNESNRHGGAGRNYLR